MAKQSSKENRPSGDDAKRKAKKEAAKKHTLGFADVDNPLHNVLERYAIAVEKEGHDEVAMMSHITHVRQLTEEDCARENKVLKEGKLADGSSYFYCAKG